MAHNVLLTNFKLFMQGQPRVSDCTFAARSLLKHPSTYLLMSSSVTSMVFFVMSNFWKLGDHKLKVDEDLVMFSLLPKLTVDKALQDVLFYLTCLAWYSFWRVRCKVKKEF